MSKITAYTALTSPQADDLLVVVDVHDTTMAASGTTKKITVANLLTNSVAWLNVVTAYGADPTGATDSTTAIQNAVTACINAGGGVVYLPAGTYKTTSTVGGDLDGAGVIVYADPGAVISYYGSGDCIRMYDSSDYDGWRGSDWRSGVYGYLSIDGANSSSSAASAGLHIGDILGVGVYCSVRNFSQHAGSINIWFDNNYTWTEQMQGRVHVAAGGTNVMFDNSANTSGGATGSYDRAVIDIFVENDGVGDGVTVNNGAILLDGRIGIYGNVSTSATQYAVLKVTGNNTDNRSLIQNSVLNIGVELDDNTSLAPYTIYQGAAAGGDTQLLGCTGVLDFSGGYPMTASNFNLADFTFLGQIFGDDNLSPYGQYGASSAIGGLYTTAVAMIAGTTDVAPLQFAAGTNLTTAAAGSVEFDGTAFYATAAASSRQVVDAEQFVCLSGSYTLANSTSAQKLFNASTNGALTVAGSTSYFFECEFDITGLSSSTHTTEFGFALGGSASVTSIKYLADTNTGAAGTLAAWNTIVVTSASATAITAAGTATTVQVRIKGIIRMNVGGTITPQITMLTNAAAAVVSANSRFRIWPAGSNTVTNVGDWS